MATGQTQSARGAGTVGGSTRRADQSFSSKEKGLGLPRPDQPFSTPER